MTMAEYLKSARMTDAERAAWLTRYNVTERTELPFNSLDAYDAHSHHEEYGAARH